MSKIASAMPMLGHMTQQFQVRVVQRMAAVCASIAGLAFLASLVSWMIFWRGIPLWHQFVDQGLYLKSATALAHGDLSPALHHYPPLYPLLAAPFTWLTPNDPFFLINLAALMAAVAMLVQMFASVIGSPAIAGLFAVGFLANQGVLFETFVIPWTSTPATLLVVAALYCLTKFEQQKDANPKYSLALGVTLGLLVPTRPLDAIVALSLVPFWMLILWRATTLNRKERWRSLALLGIGATAGPIILFGFNYLVFGGPFSPYVVTSASEFYWGNLPEKFISIFLDSATLFIQPAQTLLRRFPWLTVGLCAIAVCFRYGPIWLRAAAAAVALQFVLYLGYTDLWPNGLYNNLNYHYFRWALWIDFLMLPTAWVLLQRRFQGHAWQPVALLLLCAIALACLQLRSSEKSISVSTWGDRIVLDLPAEGRIDYVDIAGLEGNWQKTYFTDPLAEFNGRRLQLDRDIKGLQTINGTRLLFVRPLTGGRLEFPSDGWSLGAPLSARAGARSFAMGIPRSVGRQSNAIPAGALRLDGLASNYLFARGFGDFDNRRRIITHREATLDLTLEPRSTSYHLRLRLIAQKPIAIAFYLMNSDSPIQTVELAEQPEIVDLSIPPAAVAAGGSTPIRIRPQWSTAADFDAAPAIVAAQLD